MSLVEALHARAAMARVEAPWPTMGPCRSGGEGERERQARLGWLQEGVPWGGAAGARGARGCSVRFARDGLLPACCAVREEEEEEREKKKKRKEKKKEKNMKKFLNLKNYVEKNKRQFMKIYA
jgi:hypothetical protein